MPDWMCEKWVLQVVGISVNKTFTCINIFGVLKHRQDMFVKFKRDDVQ